MSSVDAGAHDGRLELAARALQSVLIGLIGYGVVVGNLSVVVNGILALGVTFFPDAIERRYDHPVDPLLTVWIALAAVIHVAGLLGPYESVPWYDNFAHAVSAAFVAGVAYAVIEALDQSSSHVEIPSRFRFVFTLIFVLAFGVAWEIVEFAAGGVAALLSARSVLIQYGMADTVLDLVFNTIAAVLVVLWGTRYFDDIAAIVSQRIRDTERP